MDYSLFASELLAAAVEAGFTAGLLGGTLAVFVWLALGQLHSAWAERAQSRARVNAARSRAAGGMGVPPMSDLSRPAFPYQGAGGELGRVSSASLGPSQLHAAGGRVGEQGEDPRPLPVDQAEPFSCLKDKRAEGASVLRCAHVVAGGSVKTPSVLEELPVTTSGPSFI